MYPGTQRLQPEERKMISERHSARFRIGQVWHYKTRPQEPKSTLTIVKIDSLPKLGTVVHISVKNLRMKNPLSKSGFSETIAHMPFSEAAIDGSVDRLVEEQAEIPNYEEGYEEWKQAVDSGKGGIFTITVAQAIDAMEHVLNQPRR